MSSIIAKIAEYDDSLQALTEQNKDNPVFASLYSGMSLLLDFIKPYQIFLQAILNSGDPTKSNPKEIVHAIGVFLENLMETVQDVDAIVSAFKDDNPALADKMSIRVKNFPNDAREVFKALTKICLINESSSLSDGVINGAEAEQSMIDALKSLKTDVDSIGFLFSRQLETGQRIIDILNLNFNALNTSLEANDLILSDIQSDFLFRFSLAASSLDIGLKVTKDFIFKKFPSITEFDDVMQKVGEQKSAFDSVALTIIDGINQLLTNFRMFYDRKIDEEIKNIERAFRAMRESIVKLMRRNLERVEDVENCLARDGFEDRVKSVVDVMLNASSSVDGLISDSSSMMKLITEYDSYTYEVARVIIRTNNDDELERNLQQVNKCLALEFVEHFMSFLSSG